MIISDALSCLGLMKKYFRDCQGLVKWGYNHMFSWIAYLSKYTTINRPKYDINSWIWNIKFILNFNWK